MPSKLFSKKIVLITIVFSFSIDCFAQGYSWDNNHTCQVWVSLNEKIKTFKILNGSCEDGFLSGQARIQIFENSKLYSTTTGNFVKGVLHGQAEVYWNEQGTNFVGEYKDGYKNKGRYTQADGSVYTGGFNPDGHMEGEHVVFEFADGKRYEGGYRYSSAYGYGTYYFKNGDKFTGLFEIRKQPDGSLFLSNSGTMYYIDGRTETGMLGLEKGGGYALKASSNTKAPVRTPVNATIIRQNANPQQNNNTLSEFRSVEEAKSYLKANFYEGSTNYKSYKLGYRNAKFIYLKTRVLFVIQREKGETSIYAHLFWEETGRIKLQNNSVDIPSIFWDLNARFDFRKESGLFFPSELNGPILKRPDSMNEQIAENINAALAYIRANYKETEKDIESDDAMQNQLIEKEKQEISKNRSEYKNDRLKSLFGSVDEARAYLEENFSKGYTLDQKYYYTITYSDEGFVMKFNNYDKEKKTLGVMVQNSHLSWRDVVSCYVQIFDPALRAVTGSTNTKFYFSINRRGGWNGLGTIMTEKDPDIFLYYNWGDEKKYEKIANALEYMAAFYKP